ncbi:MAG TPA: SGNH/GDSL hydrolase family protein [Acidobacteriota bacterium]|nr:SGNH/GDSL hydrolase family protein [Acidobacteriota bacterium]
MYSENLEPWAVRSCDESELTVRRRRIFKLVAFLLPFLVLALLEGGLRLFGFGDSYPLFVEADQAPGYLRTNLQVVRRFMVDESNTPSLWIRPVFFPRKKSPETFRIFVQGGSSAEGYPFGYAASMAGMLQQRLQSTFPHRKIELVTTAMSAVNSYTLLDFVDEIIEQSPDAVVIYAGHNEYLGILGVGSGFSVGRLRPMVLSFLWLRKWRAFQMLQRIVAFLKPGSHRIQKRGRTLMATIVRDREIPFGSRLYQRGIEQYRANLNAILSRYRRAGIPVLIGTVASNERDQPPFISGHARKTDEEVLQGHLEAAGRLLKSGRAEAALAEFDLAAALDDIHAWAHYGRAQALDRLGRFAEARQAYLAAKDRDQLRFRAPEAINRVIREVAAQQGAHLVDVQQALANGARDGIIGHDLMMEHLHPNIRGYFLMADAYYQAFRERGLIGSWTNAVSTQVAWDVAPVTEVDRLYGQWRAQYLVSDWPFSERKRSFRPPAANTPPEKIARDYYKSRYQWPDAMRALLTHYVRAGQVDEAAKVATLLAEAFPYRADDQAVAHHWLKKAGRPEAEIYLRRSQSPQGKTQTGHR